MKTMLGFLLLTFALVDRVPQKNKIYKFTSINPVQWIIPNTDTMNYTWNAKTNELHLVRKVFDYKRANIAYPAQLDLRDGIIELDIKSPAGQNAYVGFAFRIRDAHHYEAVYFRPKYSGTTSAIQYMPEKKLDFNWWDYEAAKYQAKAVLPDGEWFHVKAVFKGDKLEVFVNHQNKPVMAYQALDKSLTHGSAGFYLGNCVSCDYKNLIITDLDK